MAVDGGAGDHGPGSTQTGNPQATLCRKSHILGPQTLGLSPPGAAMARSHGVGVVVGRRREAPIVVTRACLSLSRCSYTAHNTFCAEW